MFNEFKLKISNEDFQSLIRIFQQEDKTKGKKRNN